MEAIKGKLLLPLRTQNKSALCQVSLSYSGSLGQGYASQAPTGHPCGRAWEQDESPQGTQSPREPWNEQTNPSYQFFKIHKVIPRAGHSVLHSLVFLDSPVVPAKKKRNKEKNTLVCLPFIGPYHVVSKFMVSLDHLQGDHKVDVGIGVPQLVEFNID